VRLHALLPWHCPCAITSPCFNGERVSSERNISDAGVLRNVFANALDLALKLAILFCPAYENICVSRESAIAG